MKLKIFILILILSTTIFTENIEEKIVLARELSWDGKFEQSEKIYKELIEENPTGEVIFGYANMLAWDDRIDEALEVLSMLKENENVLLKKATFLTWKGDEEKAKDIFEKLQKSGLEIGDLGQVVLEKFENLEDQKKVDEVKKISDSGKYQEARDKFLELAEDGIELDAEALEFIDWYENYQRFGIHYTYAGELGADYEDILGGIINLKEEGILETPAVSVKFDNYGKYTVILKREYRYVDNEKRNNTDIIDFYISNWYLSTGRNTYENYFLSAEYMYKLLTLGIRHDNYGDKTSNRYKIGLDYYFPAFFVNGVANIVPNGKDFYSGKIKYGNFEYRQDFNLIDSNSAMVTYEQKYFDTIENKLGVKKDFENDVYSAIFEIGLVW